MAPKGTKKKSDKGERPRSPALPAPIWSIRVARVVSELRWQARTERGFSTRVAKALGKDKAVIANWVTGRCLPKGQNVLDLEAFLETGQVLKRGSSAPLPPTRARIEVPVLVRAARKAFGASLAELARAIGEKPSVLKAWASNTIKPSAGERAFLRILTTSPELTLAALGVERGPGKRRRRA